MRSQKDHMSMRFCNEFTNADVTSGHWKELVEIKRLYALVFEMHSGLINHNDLLKETEKQGINLIDQQIYSQE